VKGFVKGSEVESLGLFVDDQHQGRMGKYSVTSAAGTKVEVQFTVSDGKDLVANCIIG